MPTYLDFRVTLQDVQPAIWRRFLIRADSTFAELHDAIQAACGWQDEHLYLFYGKRINERAIAGVPDEDDPLTPDAEQVGLLDHFGSTKRCVYLYDFGDGWEHEVRLEGRQELAEDFERRLVGGARAFPPEDCGGVGGYEACLAAVQDRSDRELLAWLGEWDPERFALEQVARKFDRPKARRASGA